MTRRNALNLRVVVFRCCSAPGQLRSGASPRSSRALGPMMLSPTLGRRRSDCPPFRHELPAQYPRVGALSIFKAATLHSYLDLYLTSGTGIFGCDYAFQYTWFRQREETKNFDLRICIYICLQSALSHSLVSHCIALSCPKHGITVKYSFSSLHTFFLLYLPRWLLTLEFFESSYLDFFWRKSHICT
jgi:hypothetical protein